MNNRIIKNSRALYSFYREPVHGVRVTNGIRRKKKKKKKGSTMLTDAKSDKYISVFRLTITRRKWCIRFTVAIGITAFFLSFSRICKFLMENISIIRVASLASCDSKHEANFISKMVHKREKRRRRRSSKKGVEFRKRDAI